jgi:hypothetical protein
VTIDDAVWKLVLDSTKVTHKDYLVSANSSFVRELQGTGQSILASLALACGLEHQAKVHWEDAVNGCDHATWPAYQIARQHYLRQEYREACLWFDRVSYDLVDRLQVSAAILAALSCFRLDEYEQAQLRASNLIKKLPILEDGYHIYIASASKLKETSIAAESRSLLDELIKRRSSCVTTCLE